MHKAIIIIAGALLLQGCTLLGIAYNNMHHLIVWRADGYLDLSREQKKELRKRLVDYLAWHRREELPLYIALLQDMQKQISKGITAEGWHRIVGDFEAGHARLLEQMGRDVAELMTSLAPDQIAHLGRKMTDENLALEDKLASSAQSRNEERLRRLQDWLKNLYGPFTPRQVSAVERIYTHTAGLQDPLLYRLERRRQSQQDLLELLQRRSTATETEAWLVEWRAGWQSRRASHEWRARLEARVLAIDALLTPQQRLHAVEKLQSYVDIMAELAGPPYSSS